VASGKGEIKRLSIDPSLIKPDEREVLEDLIVAAANDARTKAEALLAEKMRAATGGLQLPPGFGGQ
jgi:DNA-binding protein YbaB